MVKKFTSLIALCCDADLSRVPGELPWLEALLLRSVRFSTVGHETQISERAAGGRFGTRSFGLGVLGW